jgi:NFACT N-terminal and middle domains/NFACT protein RNA binding domain
VDAATLDGLLEELRPRLVGRHLGRSRLSGPAALSFEISGDKTHRLWLDASRLHAGPYFVGKETVRELESLAVAGAKGRARQAALLVRKHVDGGRVRSLRRIPGSRVVVVETGDTQLVLALQAAPALGIVAEGALVGTLGDGEVPWPPPADAPEREWDRVDAEVVAAAWREAQAQDRSTVRAVLEVCPGLTPRLARALDGTSASFERLRRVFASAHPTLLAPAAAGERHDADLVSSEAYALLPGPVPGASASALSRRRSWVEAGSAFLVARLHGERFEAARKQAGDELRRRLRRLTQLEAHLLRDLAGLPDEAELRRNGEALLAWPSPLPPGEVEVEVPDPYEPTRRRRVAIDPALPGPRNADRIFAKARRIERARHQIEARLRETRSQLVAARGLEDRVRSARDLADLPATGASGESLAPGGTTALRKGQTGGPRHYLTSHGLSLFVGRGAKENHHLTFAVARPDDLWLHARDAPGSHVIVKDNEGRAGAEDLREAAEVAAFFSEAKTEAQVDVHVTRRKHVRPGRGGPGRVVLGHTENLRVAPRDPEGRLRRR